MPKKNNNNLRPLPLTKQGEKATSSLMPARQTASLTKASPHVWAKILSVLLYIRGYGEKGESVYIYWLDEMTGKFLTHIPNRAEGERKRVWGRGGREVWRQNKDVHSMQTTACLLNRRVRNLGNGVMKEWRKRGWKGGRERACQMKGTPWLDNEAEGVNMSAILWGLGGVGLEVQWRIVGATSSLLPVRSVIYQDRDGTHT